MPHRREDSAAIKGNKWPESDAPEERWASMPPRLTSAKLKNDHSITENARNRERIAATQCCSMWLRDESNLHFDLFPQPAGTH